MVRAYAISLETMLQEIGHKLDGLIGIVQSLDDGIPYICCVYLCVCLCVCVCVCVYVCMYVCDCGCDPCVGWW